MQHLLFPTDFSPQANHAFQYALAFAQHYDLHITVMHVFHLNETEARLAPVDILEDLHSSRKELAFERFQAYRDMAEQVGFTDLRIEPVAGSGFAADLILATCASINTDVIMLGCKGDGGLSDRIFGSVALRIMRDATCPVLAIPEKAYFRPIHILFFAAANQDEGQKFNLQLTVIRDRLQAELSNVHVIAKDNHHIVEKLIELIQDLQADAVIISPQHHSYLHNLLHPSITEQLTEALEVPIWAI